MSDKPWWEDKDPEFVNELMRRQHPFHNPKRPKIECQECQEIIGIQRQARQNRVPQSRSIEPQQPVKRKRQWLKYWQ